MDPWDKFREYLMDNIEGEIMTNHGIQTHLVFNILDSNLKIEEDNEQDSLSLNKMSVFRSGEMVMESYSFLKWWKAEGQLNKAELPCVAHT